jgi:hypothetical protein
MVDRGFCIAANIIQGEIDEFERITLLLHISNDRLGDKVIEQVNNWNGPISLAVAFPDGTKFNSTIVKCAIDTVSYFGRIYIRILLAFGISTTR